MSAFRRLYGWQHRLHCGWSLHGYWCGYIGRRPTPDSTPREVGRAREGESRG